MRFSSRQRHSNGKPDSLKGGAYVLAFNSVVTQKFLTPAPGTDRANFLAVPTHAPTGDVERSRRPLPLDGMIKPPVISILCTRDLLIESTRVVLTCQRKEMEPSLRRITVVGQHFGFIPQARIQSSSVRIRTSSKPARFRYVSISCGVEFCVICGGRFAGENAR